ncbi:MAG: hypothetical protein HQK51_19935 [Oligoflexia bacterium]|nr:hypothetical protein [Oligoflexia bacterium]
MVIVINCTANKIKAEAEAEVLDNLTFDNLDALTCMHTPFSGDKHIF